MTLAARTIHGTVLGVVLAITAGFYATTPVVYAYFSEVSMSYARGPRWFAATPSAVATARWFAGYNADAPRASRFNRQLSCFLVDSGAKRRPGCLHELRSGSLVSGPPTLKVPAGVYEVDMEFTALDACDGGTARLQVLTSGTFGRTLADHTGRVAPGDVVALPFRLRLMDAALAPLEFRVSVSDGCVVLSRAHWVSAPSRTTFMSRAE